MTKADIVSEIAKSTGSEKVQVQAIVEAFMESIKGSLAQNNNVSITLFSFDKGEEISSHKAGGDAFVTCLDGEGEITIDGEKYILHTGESIVMPKDHPHAVFGKEKFKMLLVVVF